MKKSSPRFFKGITMSGWVVFFLCFYLNVYPIALEAQSYRNLADKVSVNAENKSLATVIASLEKQTAYTYIYDPEYLKQCAVSVKFMDNKLSEVLAYLDSYAPVDIEYTNNTIALRKGKQERNAEEEKGRVGGKVVDGKNEPLPGVTIQVNGGQGIVTNVDGTYELLLAPGSYTLTFSFISFETRQVTDVVVKEKALTPLNIVLKNTGSTLKAVTVTANYKRASVEGLYAIQKNNAAISDGISAEQIGRTPDKNIGEVLKRVSGVSTMENKYVVVRGLSERYNQAVLNGQVMPSTELNRKNFSFDIIPSNIIDNVTVMKTLTPDRNAEFGGGLVEVNTIDIPTKNFLSLTAGGSVNNKTTGKDFLTLRLEGKEYLGKVSDHRQLLGRTDWGSTKEVINKYDAASKDASLFSNNWGLYKLKAQPSQNYQLSLGHVINLKENDKLGVIASLSYRNTLATQDVRMSRDGWEPGGSEPTLGLTGFKGQRYGFTTNMAGLLGVGYRNDRSLVSFQSLYIRTLDQQLIIGTNNNETTMGYYDLATQTTLWQNVLKGEHAIGKKGVKFRWSGSYMQLERIRPDNHQFIAEYVKGDSTALNEFSIGPVRSNAISSGALRWWTRAHEENFNWDASVNVPFIFNVGKAAFSNSLKVGYAGWHKDRLFYVLNAGTSYGLAGDYMPLSAAFDPGNDVSLYFSQFSDDFKRQASLHAGYVMLDNKINDKLRLVWGIRAEYYDLNKANMALDSLFSWINQSRGNDVKYDYSELLNREPNWNFFPSANLTYSLTHSMNLRLSYAKSIIRPDLREMSFFREYDFELGGLYSSELVKSSIAHHADFRYEWYPSPGDILSFSLFYKKFTYPMEIYADEQSGGLYELRNNKNAKNYGLEMELRKSLEFTQVPVVKNITLYGNFTALRTYVTPMSINYNSLDPNNPLKITPIESVGDEEKRPQTGASNYIANAGFYYDTKPFSLSLVYNYVSNRMFRPDKFYPFSLFERPLEALDGQVAVRFLKGKGEVKLNISNLLDSYIVVYKNQYTDSEIASGRKKPTTKQMLYDREEDIIDFEARPGRTFSLSVSYSF